MNGTQLCYLTIAQAAPLIREGTLSPVTLAQAFLARIGALNDSLCAFVTVTSERALADAKRAEREIAAGVYRGALHGIPVALKDIYDTAGIRTTNVPLTRRPDTRARLRGSPPAARRRRGVTW